MHRVVVLWVGHWPYMQLTVVQFLPDTLPDVIHEHAEMLHITECDYTPLQEKNNTILSMSLVRKIRL